MYLRFSFNIFCAAPSDNIDDVRIKQTARPVMIIEIPTQDKVNFDFVRLI